MSVRPYLVNGEWRTGEGTFEVHSPFDDSVVAEIGVPTAADVEEATATAASTFEESRKLPVWARSEALDHISKRLGETIEENAKLIAAEGGKPLKWATVEATRAASTFRWASEVIRHGDDELMRLDTEQSLGSRVGILRRFPIGPVLGITPFNFPLNLVAHKVAPAIAVGAPVVVKPAPKTPLSALMLGQILAGTDLPPGMVSVINVPNDQAGTLVADERLPVVSFTGSGPVGYGIHQAVPGKHVILELGGNAAAVVCSDWASEADLDWAATRIATFSNYQAGQSCIGVQRVIVAEVLYDEFVGRLTAAVEGLAVGDPSDDATQVGPVINEDAAARIVAWVDEAVEAGARVRTGGKRDGNTVEPTVLTDVPHDAKVSCDEVFGPVLLVERARDEAAAFASVNASPYGLQAGVFTHSLQTAFAAHRELEVGGVIIGDVPSYRADQMPYGGAKQSGVGREGVRYAMADFTYERVMVLTGLDL